jgi:ABC-type transport system substrate-binding protein
MEYLQSSDPATRQELTYKAQEILNETRPLIILAGENTLEAYRNDKFEFPHDTCDVGVGIASPQGLLNAVVK